VVSYRPWRRFFVGQNVVPVSIAMRHKLLYNRPAPAGELSRIGDQLQQAGLLHDALEFYEGAKAKDRLEMIISKAISEADLILYLNAEKALGREPQKELLERLKDSALRLQKDSIARRIDLLLVPKGK
jgi:hypothetical protein